MNKQHIEIGHPLRVSVYWYDKVPEPPIETLYDSEVIGWRNAQMIVRVPSYSVLRFWKRSGLEVGNGDSERRGFRVDLPDLAQSLKPEIEVEMPVATDTDA